MTEDLVKKGKEIAFRYISARSRTEYEVRSYLRQKGIPEDIIEQIIEYCKGYKYIDDERFATFFAEDALRIKKYGKNRIYLELKKRGITPDIQNKVLDNLFKEIDEVNLAIKILQKKFQKEKLKEVKTKSKAANFLLRRGFNWEIIYEAFKRIESS